MKYVIALFLLVSNPIPQWAKAAFTDFADLNTGSQFSLGQIFVSKGLEFKVESYLMTNDAVLIDGTQGLPSPPPSVFLAGFGLNFLVPPNTKEISLVYADGAFGEVIVNGVEALNPGTGGFSYLDGTTIDGVEISTNVLRVSPVGASEDGELFLRGPITSFVIRGLELSIDNVSVRVPEPNSLLFILLAAGCICIRRLRLRDVKPPSPIFWQKSKFFSGVDSHAEVDRGSVVFWHH